jgi:hypothetical protein
MYSTSIWQERVAHPKKTSKVKGDLSRDVIREAMRSVGWRAVSIVAIGEV